MKLQTLAVSNYRCFSYLGPMPFHQLTVVVGGNGVGKTALVEVLEILLTNASPPAGAYRVEEVAGTSDSKLPIVVDATFLTSEISAVPDSWIPDNDHQLKLRLTVDPRRSRYEVWSLGFTDERFAMFETEKRPSQIALLKELGIRPASNADLRIEQFREAVKNEVLPRAKKYVEVPFSHLKSHLPEFERVAPAEYQHPDSVLQRMFRAAVDRYLRPTEPGGGAAKWKDVLVSLHNEINQHLHDEAQKLKEYLYRADDSVREISVTSEVDFTRSVGAVKLMMDQGHGLQLVSGCGEGTKKKVWMALLEWDRDSQRSNNPLILRAYDEPDVNLDYAAERRLFSTIIDATSDHHESLQCVVCTHSMTMIDRAPAESINLLEVDAAGNHQISYVSAGDDDDVRAFLTTAGRSVGLSNSALFFEKAFLVFEGQSEENALPLLYRNLYDRSFVDDGIVPVTLHSYGSWNAVLSLLKRYRADRTLVLLDTDTTDADAVKGISRDRLIDMGFPSDFLDHSCFFVGDREFEDAFRTQEYVEVFNTHWPREDGREWQADDVDRYRRTGDKFSDALVATLRRESRRCLRSTARKPDVASRVAELCRSREQVPNVIQTVFDRLRALVAE